MITQSYDAPVINKLTTAAILQSECQRCFGDVLSADIGLFKKWTLSSADVCGAARYVPTKAAHIRKAEADSVCEELEELARQRIVLPFRGKVHQLIPWFSVSKKGQLSRRVVMDFRAVNCLSMATPTIPLDRDGAIEIVAGRKYYTKLDLTSGYFQIGLHEDTRAYFVFAWKGELWAFARLPMGWKNSSSWFMMAVNETVADIRAEFRRRSINAQIASYVDDLAIASDEMEDHARAVMTCFEVFRAHGWTIKPDKIVLASTHIEFLGRTLSQEGVNVSDDIRSRVQRMSPPRNVHEVRSALGLMRCMLSHCRIDTRGLAVLHTMLNWKSVQIAEYWRQHSEEWNKVLRQFNKCWYLSQGRPNKRLDLYIDACGHGYGFALFDADSQRLVHMGCGHLDAAEFKSSGHAETIALKKSLHSCRPFIIGGQFRVFTDSTVVLNGSNPKNQSLIVQRFLDALNLTAGSLHHVDGVSNTMADILSRSKFWQASLSDHKPDEEKQVSQACNQAGRDEAAAEEKEGPEDVAAGGWYKHLPEFLTKNTYPHGWNEIKKKRLRERARNFRLHGARLEYFNGAQWVQCCKHSEDKIEALTTAHDNQGHYGEAETERRETLRILAGDVQGCRKTRSYLHQVPEAGSKGHTACIQEYVMDRSE